MNVVVFSDHAIKRCLQRGIDIEHLRGQLEELPQLINITNWWVGKVRVTLATYPDHIIVVTACRRNK